MSLNDNQKNQNKKKTWRWQKRQIVFEMDSLIEIEKEYRRLNEEEVNDKLYLYLEL